MSFHYNTVYVDVHYRSKADMASFITLGEPAWAVGLSLMVILLLLRYGEWVHTCNIHHLCLTRPSHLMMYARRSMGLKHASKHSSDCNFHLAQVDRSSPC